MPRTRLETGDVPGRIWCVIGVALLVSAFIDAAIAVTHVVGVPHWRPWLASAGFACTLLMLGGLALSPSLTTRGRGNLRRKRERCPVMT